jgi:hypothetical protein
MQLSMTERAAFSVAMQRWRRPLYCAQSRDKTEISVYLITVNVSCCNDVQAEVKTETQPVSETLFT